MKMNENNVREVLWKSSYDPKKIKLSKKAEALKGWTACKLQEGAKLDLIEYVKLAFGNSVKANNGKFALKDLPEWKHIEAFCLDSAKACEAPENGGSSAKLWWDIVASRSGATFYLKAKKAEERPMKFEIPAPKAETTETTEPEAATEATEATASEADSLAKEGAELLAEAIKFGRGAEAIALLKSLLGKGAEAAA